LPRGRVTKRSALGSRAEDAAADFLVAREFEIIGRNVRAGVCELDIVARRGELVAIVEVRTRGDGAFASALASVDAKKRGALVRGGERLWREKLSQLPGITRLRFDVAAVTFGAGGVEVELIEAAFTA
jgi:putative endonuclease